MVRLYCNVIWWWWGTNHDQRGLYLSWKVPWGRLQRLGKSLEQLRAPWAFAICLKLLEPIFGCYIMWKERLFNNLMLWTMIYFFIVLWEETESVIIVLLIQFFVSQKLNMLIQIFFHTQHLYFHMSVLEWKTTHYNCITVDFTSN